MITNARLHSHYITFETERYKWRVYLKRRRATHQYFLSDTVLRQKIDLPHIDIVSTSSAQRLIDQALRALDIGSDTIIDMQKFMEHPL